MPTIPYYNLNETEGEDLNRAKKMVQQREMEKFSEITEYPDQDPTDGGADQMAQKITDQLNQLEPLAISIDGFIKQYGNTNTTTFVNTQSYNQTIQVLGVIYNKLNTIFEQTKDLRANFNYLSLNTVQALKTQVDKSYAMFVDVNGRFLQDLRRLRQTIGPVGVDIDPVIGLVSQIRSTMNRIAEIVNQELQIYATARQQRIPDQSEVSGSALPAFNPRGEVILPRSTGHTYRVGNPKYLEQKYL